MDDQIPTAMVYRYRAAMSSKAPSIRSRPLAHALKMPPGLVNSLSDPTDLLIKMMSQLEGDILILERVARLARR